MKNGVRYVSEQELVNVSYKTVVTALKESELEIIKAVLIPLVNTEFELKIKVSLEYLNEIQEFFHFKG